MVQDVISFEGNRMINLLSSLASADLSNLKQPPMATILILLVAILTIILFILDIATKGKYRTRPVVLITLGVGLILGIIYALACIGKL